MSTLTTLIQVWGKMLYLQIWYQKFNRKIWHQNVWRGRYKVATPWDGHTYCWGGIVPNIRCGQEDWEWGRHTCWKYYQEENCLWPPCIGGMTQVGFVEGLQWGVIVNRVGMSCSNTSQIWGSWYLPRFLFNVGSLTLMYIASLMILVKPYGSLPTMEKLSSVMLWPVVRKCSKMGERALRCSLYLTNISACLHSVFHCEPWLIASVPVYDYPFVDDAVLVLRN